MHLVLLLLACSSGPQRRQAYPNDYTRQKCEGGRRGVNLIAVSLGNDDRSDEPECQRYSLVASPNVAILKHSVIDVPECLQPSTLTRLRLPNNHPPMLVAVRGRLSYRHDGSGYNLATFALQK